MANHSVSVESGRTVIYGGVAPPVPAWLSAIPVGNWGAVGANTISDIDPADDPALNSNHPSPAPWRGVIGLPALVSAWCGGAYDQDSKAFYLHGGGHTDYAGNEVFSIDLSVDSPSWEMLIPPTGSIGNVGALNDGLESSGEYFDGRPRSVHTTNTLLVANGAIYRIPTGSQYENGNGNLASFRFDPAPTNDWTRLPDRPAGGGTFGGSAHVPGVGSGKIWTFPNDNSFPHSYDIDSNSWTSHTGIFTNADNYVRPMYDAVSGQILLFANGYAPGKVAYFDPASPANPISLTTTGTPPTNAHNGVAYDSVNDVYLCWESGTGIFRLTPPVTGDRVAGTWTWDVLDAGAGNVVTPSSPTANGTFNRCFYDAEYQVYGVLNAVDEQIYIRRLG